MHRRLESLFILCSSLVEVFFLLGAALSSGFMPNAAAASAGPGNGMVDAYVVLEGPPAALAAPKAGAVAPMSSLAPSKQRGMELETQHAVLQTRLQAGGAKILSRYTRIGNAIRIRISSDKLAGIESIPGVKRVFKARQYHRSLSHSVPFIGTPAVWSAMPQGIDGRGVRVGVIDTGIDYLHADFGGSGSTADYKKNDPARIEPGTFPTAKVIGGYDFAGDEYDAAYPQNSIPHPDLDPLDSGPGDGHGTHVAGILAGFGVLNNGQTYRGDYSTSLDLQQFSIGPGVAPQALLYALRIFGTNTDGTTALVADALEWAADPNKDYDFSDRLDVVNLSLGSSFGTDDPEDPELVAVNNLAKLGCIVVCAAGNDGNVFYAAGPPGSASRCIAVANTIDKAERGAIEILSPSSIAGKWQAVEGDFTAKLADIGPVEAPVVYAEPQDACDILENTDALLDRIALIDRGTCFFTDKIRAAQDAGAIGVIMVNNVDGDPFIMGGEDPDNYIPGVMISKADGDILKAHLHENPIVRLDASLKVTLTSRLDNLSDSSSRGPVGLANYLKPEIAAPGSDIYSAMAGSGTSGIRYSGTSMASPMIAGAAAILRQAHPQWPVEDIKAALMNSTVPTHDFHGFQYPESMTGAGRVQLDKALQLQVTAASAEAAGNVALCFGSLALTSPFQTNRTVILTNHGNSAVTFQVAVSNTIAQAGVTLTPSASSVTIPALGSATVSFTLNANPAQFSLSRDPVTPAAVGSYSRQTLYEFSGQVWFLQESQSLHVPFYANLRGASDFETPAKDNILAAGSYLEKKLSFTIPMAGSSPVSNAVVSAFELGAVYPNKNLLSVYSSDAHLLAIGAASDIAAAGSIGNSRVYFGLATATSWPSPQPSYVNFQVDIDTNRDGYSDFIISNDNAYPTNSDPAASDVFVNLIDAYDSDGYLASSEPDGYLNVFAADKLDTAPFNNSVMVLSAPAHKIGLSPTRHTFQYRVLTSGIFDYISETGWIDFDALNPVVDASASGIEGTPMHADGQPILALVNQEAAAKNRQRLPGILLLHHHNVEGSRIDVVRFDLSQDDLDNDGLPDWWEQANFGSITVSDGSGDYDGDGNLDRAEYQAGTDPAGGQQRLTLQSAVMQADRSVKISWSGSRSSSCTILYSDSLASGNWSVLATVPAGSTPAGVFVDTNNSGAKTRFYRIRRN